MRKWDWPHPKRDQTGWLRAKLVCFYDDKSAGITKARIETTTLGNIAESITEVRAAVCASAELCLRQNACTYVYPLRNSRACLGGCSESGQCAAVCDVTFTGV